MHVRLFTLGILIGGLLLTSCASFQNFPEVRNGTSDSKIDLDEVHSSISAGTPIEEIRHLLGPPQNRQFYDNQETWQYCKTKLERHYFYTVSFLDERVIGITSYNVPRYDNDCSNCKRCFQEVFFK